MKSWSKCPCFKKLPPLWKIPGCAPEHWPILSFIYVSIIISNYFVQASAGSVINVTSVWKHISQVAREGTERIAASPSTTHLTSLRYSWLELFDRLIMQFLNSALSGCYTVHSEVATVRGSKVISCLNASVNFTDLLTSKPRAWKTSFTTDKDF